jgi:serine/threonine protein kinase
VGHINPDRNIQRAISWSVKEIHSLGILHQDLRPENILWNAELKQALIINFHQCTLDNQPGHKWLGSLKQLRSGPNECESKRVRVM